MVSIDPKKIVSKPHSVSNVSFSALWAEYKVTISHLKALRDDVRKAYWVNVRQKTSSCHPLRVLSCIAQQNNRLGDEFLYKVHGS